MTIKSTVTLVAAATAVALMTPLLVSAQTLPQTLGGNHTIASSDYERIALEGKTYKCGDIEGWGEVKYACTWNHSGIRNFFYKRYDGTYLYECSCYNSLRIFESLRDYPVPRRWYISRTALVECKTRDGRITPGVESEFDSVNCRPNERVCDTRKGSCTYK